MAYLKGPHHAQFHPNHHLLQGFAFGHHGASSMAGMSATAMHHGGSLLGGAADPSSALGSSAYGPCEYYCE
jgi:hypothetical protein